MNGNTIHVEYMYILEPARRASPRISMLVRRLSFGSSMLRAWQMHFIARTILLSDKKNTINDPPVLENDINETNADNTDVKFALANNLGEVSVRAD